MEKPVISVKEWKCAALWAWDLKVETCAICRNHLMESCIECQANHSEEICEPAWGVCNHAFHFHCITRWLNTRNVCPLCNKEWDFQKFGSGCCSNKPAQVDGLAGDGGRL